MSREDAAFVVKVILSRHFEPRWSPNRSCDSSSKRSGSHFPVRYVLTIIAVALVAVMSVALIAPYFIDWSAQRAEIEARLSAITGANVSLTGPVELRLLPTPYLALGRRCGQRAGPGRGEAFVRLGAAGARAGQACRAGRSGSPTFASRSQF